MKHLCYLPLLLAVMLVAVAALLPNFTLAELRVAMPWFSDLINRVEALRPGMDSTHVLMFVGVGASLVFATARLQWPARIVVVLSGVGLLALASEVVQFWVPGRTPLWSDVRDDLVGGGVGVLFAVAVLGLWRLMRGLGRG